MRLHYLGGGSLNSQLADLRKADGFTSDRILDISAASGSVKNPSLLVYAAALIVIAAATATADFPRLPLRKNTRGRERYRNHTDSNQNTESNWGTRARRAFF